MKKRYDYQNPKSPIFKHLYNFYNKIKAAMAIRYFKIIIPK